MSKIEGEDEMEDSKIERNRGNVKNGIVDCVTWEESKNPNCKFRCKYLPQPRAVAAFLVCLCCSSQTAAP